jgi:tRNA (mo5U34)-methyltransferase
VGPEGISPEGISPEGIRQRVAAVTWFHSIDLGHGIVTPGASNVAPLSGTELPGFAGRSVLDVGAWDGLYSFRAEQGSATRVVALDHYAWGVSVPARQAYWDRCAAAGSLPDHDRDLNEFWDPNLPGRKGFDLAREVLGSAVEPVVGDLMTIDLDALGTFDVVLYLGVLYHMPEPLTALRRVRAVTGEVAVIETVAVRVLAQRDASLLAFYAGNELGGADFGNWFAPTQAGLVDLCRAAGFTRVETRRGPPAVKPWRDHFRRNVRRTVLEYRAAVWAWA